ncbi:glycosyltransferase family 2 protein [Peribacillus simplex]|uniref:glycosyltransferase family 2 protein n=1 Tax=Peribacillus simplex TaxID=1478 RepID=UPI000F644B5E|nr:glycosyltransferase family 2 protein [Peribacillus simplex]RRN74906.1 glycosyltransferase family 2 protein [Peribacillus simplex]
MNFLVRQKARELLKSSNIQIKNNPSSLRNKFLGKVKKVTVVTAAFNAEKFIRKTIESVINQSIGIDQIEYIIIDDCSTDDTVKIIQEYAARYKNICLVSLQENNGSPGTPRNIGIELGTSKYITFLDADDWLAPDGLESLYNILEETGDDYVVGKTVKVESESETVIGEFASIKERRSITPLDVPHFFYHMGPTARMMNLSMVKENEIGFPNMKFGEDKWFFTDVFFKVRAVSTTKKPIYYVNRTSENPYSLTRVTNVLDKRKADVEIIRYIQSKDIAIELKRVALNRIYEYDIVKTFDSQTFVKSKKKEDFIEVLRDAVETTKNLSYDFTNEFKVPIYKFAIELFMADRIDDFIRLFEWLKRDANKKYLIKDCLPYYELPFLEGDYRFVRIPMLARAIDSYVIDNVYHQSFEIYGDDINNIDSVLIRDRKRMDNEINCEVRIEGNRGHFTVSLDEIDRMEKSLFTVFIRYNDYQLVNIKRILKNKMAYNNKNVEFYTTVANNLGLAIKSLE